VVKAAWGPIEYWGVVRREMVRTSDVEHASEGCQCLSVRPSESQTPFVPRNRTGIRSSLGGVHVRPWDGFSLKARAHKHSTQGVRCEGGVWGGGAYGVSNTTEGGTLEGIIT